MVSPFVGIADEYREAGLRNIYTPHQNSESLAKGLLPQIETALPNLSCRPWDRFKWSETEWLLSPVKEFPLYRPCKYFTMMKKAEDPAESRLLAGIYVEKGFESVARTIFPPNQIMDKSWGWNGVLNGCREGAIPAVIGKFPSQCLSQTFLKVFGGYEHPEGKEESPPGGDYFITLNGDNTLSTTVKKAFKEMSPLETVKSWKDLSAALDVLTRDGWLWVNFYLYLSMPIAPRVGKPEGEVWTDDLVWMRFLKPFLPWITVK